MVLAANPFWSLPLGYWFSHVMKFYEDIWSRFDVPVHVKGVAEIDIALPT
jgi:hypothetical protein